MSEIELDSKRVSSCKLACMFFICYAISLIDSAIMW